MGSCLSGTKKKVTVVMVGLDNAGKTSAAKGLVGESPEDVAPTLGFSSFQLRHQNFEVTIYDLGGSKAIRGIWRNYLAEAFGFIFVVDASNTSRVEECREVLHNLVKNPIVMGKPFLILANKQDIEGAMDEVDVCNLLDVEHLVNSAMSRTRVETCSAIGNQGKNVDKTIQSGFRWLLTTIGLEFDALKTRVDQDVAIQQKLEAQEKAERDERVRKLREERERLESSEHIMQDESDCLPIPNGVSNPFKPISIVVKELNLSGETEVKPEQTDESPNKSNLPAQNSVTDSLHSDAVAVASPEKELCAEKTENPNRLNSASGPKLVRECSEETVATVSVKEIHRRQDVGLFLNQETDSALCPPGTVEEHAERRPVKSTPSQQSSLDVTDSCDSLSTKLSQIDPSESGTPTKSGEGKTQKSTKKSKKLMFSRNHKTAPVQDPQVSSSALRELPPLILKPSLLSHSVPWAEVTPSISSFKTASSLELDNMSR